MKGEKTQFKPGTSGNPNGRPRLPWRQALEEAIGQKEDEEKKTAVRHYVDVCWEDKTPGGMGSLMKKLVPDLAAITVSGDPENPLNVGVTLPESVLTLIRAVTEKAKKK